MPLRIQEDWTNWEDAKVDPRRLVRLGGCQGRSKKTGQTGKMPRRIREDWSNCEMPRQIREDWSDWEDAKADLKIWSNWEDAKADLRRLVRLGGCQGRSEKTGQTGRTPRRIREDWSD